MQETAAIPRTGGEEEGGRVEEGTCRAGASWTAMIEECKQTGNNKFWVLITFVDLKKILN